MANSDFIEKLDFHLQDFQEGFNILLLSKKKIDIESNYSRILKGNLFVKKVSLYYSCEENSWQKVFPISVENNVINFPVHENITVQNNFPNANNLSMIIPFESNEAYAAVISDKFDGTNFNDEDILSFKLFGQLLYYAYQSYKMNRKEKELVFSLNNKIMQLNTLIDTGIELSRLDNISQLITLALERAVTITNASKGVVRIIESDNTPQHIYFPIDFTFTKSDYEPKYIISADLIFQNIKIEYSLVEKESRSGIASFNDTDKLLVDAIVKQVQAALENEYLMQQLLDKQKMEKELELAAEIQKKIIPNHLPNIDGYKVFGINLPSKEVGGDYFDVIDLTDGRVAFIVADVTGKGVPAALLVSTLNASLTAFLELDINSSALATKLNSLIYKASTPDKFITCFIAILNSDTGELSIVNAGHNPALILKNDGSVLTIKAGGFAFGMFNLNKPYKSENLILEKGERLLIYSDGIPEAMNQNREEFSDEKLYELYRLFTPNEPKEFISKLLDELKLHSGDTPQSDDITAVYLIRNKID